MDSLRAHLLIAVPQLPDKNFYRTVVLIIQHDDEGAFGVVLNRPSNLTISKFWSKFGETPCDNPNPINVGGPVQGPLIAVHADISLSENEIFPDVYFTAQLENLDQLVRQQEKPFLVFSGYSGWAGGQLESEVEAGGWLTTPATYEYVFSDDDDLWKTVASDIGLDIMMHDMGIKHLPGDPSMN